MEDEILENLAELVNKWEDEIKELECMMGITPELEEDCSTRKEVLDEVIRDIKFLMSEFTIVD